MSASVERARKTLAGWAAEGIGGDVRFVSDDGHELTFSLGDLIERLELLLPRIPGSLVFQSRKCRWSGDVTVAPGNVTTAGDAALKVAVESLSALLADAHAKLNEQATLIVELSAQVVAFQQQAGAQQFQALEAYGEAVLRQAAFAINSSAQIGLAAADVAARNGDDSTLETVTKTIAGVVWDKLTTQFSGAVKRQLNGPAGSAGPATATAANASQSEVSFSAQELAALSRAARQCGAIDIASAVGAGPCTGDELLARLFEHGEAIKAAQDALVSALIQDGQTALLGKLNQLLNS